MACERSRWPRPALCTKARWGVLSPPLNSETPLAARNPLGRAHAHEPGMQAGIPLRVASLCPSQANEIHKRFRPAGRLHLGVVVPQPAVETLGNSLRAEPGRRQRPSPVQVPPTVRKLMRRHQFERRVDPFRRQPVQRPSTTPSASGTRSGVGCGCTTTTSGNWSARMADHRPYATQPAGFGVGQSCCAANPAPSIRAQLTAARRQRPRRAMLIRWLPHVPSDSPKHGPASA